MGLCISNCSKQKSVRVKLLELCVKSHARYVAQIVVLMLIVFAISTSAKGKELIHVPDVRLKALRSRTEAANGCELVVGTVE